MERRLARLDAGCRGPGRARVEADDPSRGVGTACVSVTADRAGRTARHRSAAQEDASMEAQGVQLCQGEGVTEYFRPRRGRPRSPARRRRRAHRLLRRPDAGRFRAQRRRPRRGVRSTTPLAMRLARALEAGGAEQRVRCSRSATRRFSSPGFFPDRLRRSPVDVDYFTSLGGYAYGSLSRLEHPGAGAGIRRAGRAVSTRWSTCSARSASARRCRRRTTCCGSTSAGCGRAAPAPASA